MKKECGGGVEPFKGSYLMDISANCQTMFLINLRNQGAEGRREQPPAAGGEAGSCGAGAGG